MQKWSIPILITIVALLLPVSAASVSAQGELSISKSADLTSATVGDTITYTYTITNTDNIIIENIYLEDDTLGIIDLGEQTSLGAGGNITATATYTVVEADLPGPLVNTATVYGTDPNNNPITASATATVELTYMASLQLIKTADPISATVGDTINYNYTIINNGNVTLYDITLEDDQLGIIGEQASLGAGDTITATATYTVVEADLPGPLVNTATVYGNDLDGNPITASAIASVDLIYTASLQLTKTADPSPAAPHETITYTYNITNNGNVTINDISLQDDKLGAILLTDTTMSPGESTTATATYAVTISDLPGPITNTATVTGTGPGDTLVSATTDPVSVSLYINKSLLTKAEILKLSGVPGKGILKAPGLQKLFNPKSKAAEHAGKKDKNKEKIRKQR